MPEQQPDPYATPEQPATSTEARNDVPTGFKEILVGHVCAVIITGLALLLTNLGGGIWAPMLAAVLLLGLVQWLYVIPLLIGSYAKGHRQTAKGIWIAAGVTMLPTAACFGLVLTSTALF